jgi:hypothetical protein
MIGCFAGGQAHNSEHIISCIGVARSDSNGLQQATRDMRALWAEVVNLAARVYRSTFRVKAAK